LTGSTLGFAIAAPVGPIGALVIRRTLAEGRATGLVTGLGAASADAMYGAVAAFGLSGINLFLMAHHQWLGLAGGAFLCYLGVTIFFARPVRIDALPAAGSRWTAYASTLFLTLANPATILSFVAVFAGMGSRGSVGGYAAAASFVTGVFAGSTLWWLLLSAAVAGLRARIGIQGLAWVNRISGSLIAGFGVWAVLGSL
jgi:threonine/homoserine/homoserine lactone efflux protein